MAEQSVTLERIDHVGVVTFSSGTNNYFDLTLIRQLVAAFHAADTDLLIRATVLRSAGKVFCAGASFSGDEDSSTDPGVLYREALALFSMRKPMVASIQGPAIGGGLGLALVADFRVAAPEARFAANFVKIGIHPGFGLSYTLPRLIGPRPAEMLLYTGDRIGGERALALGLVDEIASLDELQAAALALAGRFAESAPLAVQSTRETLREGVAAAIERHMKREQAEQSRLFDTDDFREGVKAVAERRAGQWRGA